MVLFWNVCRSLRSIDDRFWRGSERGWEGDYKNAEPEAVPVLCAQLADKLTCTFEAPTDGDFGYYSNDRHFLSMMCVWQVINMDPQRQVAYRLEADLINNSGSLSSLEQRALSNIFNR